MDTHQEVTAANQGRFYSQVVFPLEMLPSLPTKAVVGYWVGVCHRKLDMNPNVIAAAITTKPCVLVMGEC